MSSATASLFASVALAAVGAAGFAYTLTHPGVVADLASQLLDQRPDRTASNLTSTTDNAPARTAQANAYEEPLPALFRSQPATTGIFRPKPKSTAAPST